MKKHLGLTIALSGALALSALAAACGGTTTIVSGSSGSSGTSGTPADEAGITDEGGTAPDSGTVPAVDSGTSFDTPTVCTSGTMWTRGDRGSTQMHPGVNCVGCHELNGGPTLTIAGTVYPTGHEPDDCNGITGGTTTVVITDKTGQVTTIPVNSVGNFYTQASFTPPFHAKVVSNGKERAMIAGQTSGDCNSCHTVKGTMSAPGRIVAP